MSLRLQPRALRPWRGGQSETVYAEIRYEDDSGPQLYLVSQNEVRVGRGGDDLAMDLALYTNDEVSREHLTLRRDPATGRFRIVDKSINGTWLDGKRLKKGVEEALPDRAQIGVAEVLTLSFEVRKMRLFFSPHVPFVALFFLFALALAWAHWRKAGLTAMSVTAAWRAGVASDPGLLRSNNEDRVYVDEAAGHLPGGGWHGRPGRRRVGGADRARDHPAASRKLGRRYRRRACAMPSPRPTTKSIDWPQDREEWHGMACVLTLAVAHDDQITVGHVGDSRLYLVWNGTLRKLTADHSPVGELEDQGELTEAAAMQHPRRNEVFRDVGSRPRDADDEEFIQIKSFPFRPGAALLLCTDGLSDMLTSAEISSIVERYSGDPASTARDLVAAANQIRRQGQRQRGLCGRARVPGKRLRAHARGPGQALRYPGSRDPELVAPAAEPAGRPASRRPVTFAASIKPRQ